MEPHSESLSHSCLHPASGEPRNPGKQVHVGTPLLLRSWCSGHKEMGGKVPLKIFVLSLEPVPTYDIKRRVHLGWDMFVEN